MGIETQYLHKWTQNQNSRNYTLGNPMHSLRQKSEVKKSCGLKSSIRVVKSGCENPFLTIVKTEKASVYLLFRCIKYYRWAPRV